MSIIKQHYPRLRDCEIKTLEEFAADFRRLFVQVWESDMVDSNDLITVIQNLQRSHNTTDLVVSCEVYDDETSRIKIERRETDVELMDRVTNLYNYYLEKHKNAIAKQNNEHEIELLKQQQADIQAKIDALK